MEEIILLMDGWEVLILGKWDQVLSRWKSSRVGSAESGQINGLFFWKAAAFASCGA